MTSCCRQGDQHLGERQTAQWCHLFSFHRVREDQRERSEKRSLKSNTADKCTREASSSSNLPFFGGGFQGERGEAGADVSVSEKQNS